MAPRTERPESAFLQSALRGTRFATVVWIAETGSTNDDLVEASRRGEGEQVLITDLQTAGRGRRGRVWDAPSGSGILMSVLIRGWAPQDAFWSIGAIALAASQTIDGLITSRCSLKWPNDVMIGPRTGGGERKVAGVLSQLVDDAVIVGIGINVNWPDELPAALADRATAINHHLADRAPLDRGPIAAEILRRAIGHLDNDRPALREAWKSQCSTLGKRVRLELEGTAIEGEAIDVTIDGALILEHDGVRSAHHVGDVVHLRPAR